MNINRITTAFVAAGLLVWSASAAATWQNGQGVVFFPSSDKEKIIYWGNTNPDTGERSASTSYDKYIEQRDRVKPKKPDRNFAPAGYRPGKNWKMADKKNLYATPVTGTDVVWRAVGRSSNALYCPPNAACGEIALMVGSDQCSSREISLGLGVDGVWSKSPIKYLESMSNAISGSGAFGTSTCTSKATAYTCYSNQGKDNIKYATETYATVESRARWGYARLTPDNGEIFESPANTERNVVREICDAAGGRYYENDFTEKCMGVKDKVYWEEYNVWPVANRPTINTCRVIKGVQR